MELKNMKCSVCGGKLEEKNGTYVCEYCDSTFSVQTSENDYDRILGYLELSKQEALSNARYNLYNAVHEKYLSKEKIKTFVNEVKLLYPEDFMASFYDCLLNEDKNILNDFIQSIDLKAYGDYAKEVIEGTIKSLDYSNIIPIKDFIDRALDVKERTKYNTEIESLAEKMNDGVYSLDIDRDFFICYSSKDMKTVIEIVNYLESNGLSCFVALRNLRHGVGSAENYKESIKKAMRNSKALIFLSSNNSRDMGCDALRFELPYLKSELKDKPRIEYLIDDYSPKTSPFVKTLIKQVFDGLEWCKSLEDLTFRASSIIFDVSDKKEDTSEAVSSKEIKYCVECGTENDLDVKFCKNCGSNEFAVSIPELISKQNEKKELELRKREEEIRKETKRQLNQNKTESEHVVSNTTPKKAAANERVIKTTGDSAPSFTYEKISDKEILFGRYPQTKASGKELEALSNVKFDKTKWKDFGYYLDGKPSKFMYYLDVDCNDDGIYDYRGIYFTEYRPISIDDSFSDSYQEKNGYKKEKIYWFKYEPIKWKVLKKKDNQMMIVSKLALDSQSFTIKGFSNYMKSGIRKWLNDYFYNFAFGKSDKDMIELTDVDNSAKSTGYRNNEYICENTTDNLFLLSHSEAETLFKDESLRRAKPSDYAKSQGIAVSDDFALWWLRSPDEELDISAQVVEYDGEFGYGIIGSVINGIRPACWINLDPSSSITQVERKTESKTITSDDSSSIVSKSDQVAKATTNSKTLSAYKKISDKEILFGRYPQTLVDGSTVKELSNIRFDASKWNDYGYYENGKQSSYMYYIDVDTDGDGVYDYRGVYFTKYRPSCTSYSDSTSNSNLDDNGYYTNTIYWFKYDPVKWNILKTDGSKALIITNLLIDSQQYCAYTDGSSFSHNGGTGYPNDYALSDIRKWLNDTFYETMFTELEKTIIQVVNVDNSVSSTGCSSNNYACENTNGRMFLLSYKEASSLYSSDSARIAKVSDYAKCQGAYYISSYNGGFWWLRSPYNFSQYSARDVYNGGNLGYYNVSNTRMGVRAACWIIL